MSYPTPSQDQELIARQRKSARRLALILGGVALLIFVLGIVTVTLR